jgi:replicative DNA helicase
LVLFIYRPEMYQDVIEKNPEKAGIAEVSISKHRNGPTGAIKLKFHKEFTRFDSLESHEGPEDSGGF